jgi:hypothetical protein
MENLTIDATVDCFWNRGDEATSAHYFVQRMDRCALDLLEGPR